MLLDITNNTITLKSSATTQVITAIENASGSTAVGNEVNISNNTISNCTYTTATTGSFYGIYNTATPAILTVTIIRLPITQLLLQLRGFIILSGIMEQ